MVRLLQKLALITVEGKKSGRLYKTQVYLLEESLEFGSSVSLLL
jgi:hypothetical protein